jgi:hypothetical protein
MWEGAAIVGILAGVLFWVDSLQARERALAAGRSACLRYGVQLLDETVQFAALRVARDEDGRLRLRRSYSFEFTDTGDNRRRGAIVMLGGKLQDMQLEPYKLQ